jgi:hypothetical protein
VSSGRPIGGRRSIEAVGDGARTLWRGAGARVSGTFVAGVSRPRRHFASGRYLYLLLHRSMDLCARRQQRRLVVEIEELGLGRPGWARGDVS